MQFTNINFVAPAQCPYTVNGVKLIEMRKAALIPHATALGVPVAADTSKNDLVRMMIGKLDAGGAPLELTELAKKKTSKKRAKKK